MSHKKKYKLLKLQLSEHDSIENHSHITVLITLSYSAGFRVLGRAETTYIAQEIHSCDKTMTLHFFFLICQWQVVALSPPEQIRLVFDLITQEDTLG